MAEKLSEKKSERYDVILRYYRVKISFMALFMKGIHVPERYAVFPLYLILIFVFYKGETYKAQIMISGHLIGCASAKSSLHSIV